MGNRYQESMIEIAYDYLNEKGQLSFYDLWDYVAEEIGLTQEEKDARISIFYTDLSLDGRFVTLGENTWDLRDHHTYDKVHIDMNEIYAEVEDISALDDDDKEIVFAELDILADDDEDEEKEDEEDEDY